jgi:hypothetical protein
MHDDIRRSVALASSKDGVADGDLVAVGVGGRSVPGLGDGDVPPVGVEAGRDLLGREEHLWCQDVRGGGVRI